MEPADAIWGGLLTVAAAVEVWALRNGHLGDTFSERTRKWFRVDTKVGRAVFAVTWVGFATWYLEHILG